MYILVGKFEGKVPFERNLTVSRITLKETRKNKYIYRVCMFVIFFLRSSYIFVGLGTKDIKLRTIR